MREINCLNLTDIIQYLYTTVSDPILDFKTIVNKSNALAGFEKCERIYIGSYFCAQYFLNLPNKIIEDVTNFCEEEKVKVTLVIPIFSERNLDRGKEKIEEFINNFKEVIDEVTVNDYGMLEYMTKQYQLKCNMGRLFMKDYRDLRYPEYFNTTLHPKIFTSYFKELMTTYNIKGLEFDPTHKTVNLETCPQSSITAKLETCPPRTTASLETCPQGTTASLETCPQGITASLEKCPRDVEVGMHRPYCYMTVGQICEFGSIHKEIEKKFRPNEVCQGECNSNIFRYQFDDGHEWLRIGRAVYFDNRECEVQGVSCLRNIYFPVDLVVKK